MCNGTTVKRPINHKLLSATLFSLSVFASSPLLAAGDQRTHCVLKGGGAQVSIEYANSGCRTLMNEHGQTRQIAWAQSHPQICRNIAEKVMAKSGRAAWVCDADMAHHAPHHDVAPSSRPAKITPRKAEISIDSAILNSSRR
jgi:hypothetical protein